jgi:protein-tyrosine phosphatase
MDQPDVSTGSNAPLGLILAAHPNLRCLGGLATESGRRVRPGLFLRAPVLRTLDAAAEATLADLELTTIVDFRQPDEAAAAPAAFVGDFRLQCVSLPIRTGAAARLLGYGHGVDDATATSAMIEVYRDFVRLNADVYAAFLRVIAEAPGPVLFHCTAGKDRTGFAAGLILAALGVEAPAIMADYLATGVLWRPEADLVAHIAPAARSAMLGVQPAYLEAAFEELDRLCGGARVFARDALGEATFTHWTKRSLI